MFSRSTIVDALSLFEHNWWSTNRFDRYLMRFNLESIAPQHSGSKPSRINTVIAHLIQYPQLSGPGGAHIVLETIEFILSQSGPALEVPQSLIHSLALDGFRIGDDAKLVAVLPSAIPIASRQNEVETLLSRFSFSVPEGHLQQAHNAHTRGDWAAANSQVRTFIESLFDEFARKLVNPFPSTSHGRREQLAKLNPPFIDPSLNEWDLSGNSGFVQGFWKRLHPTGSHPGLSDEDDCTFRLQVAYLVAHRFLKRFESYP